MSEGFARVPPKDSESEGIASFSGIREDFDQEPQIEQ